MRTSFSRKLGGRLLAVADLVEWSGPDPGSSCPAGYLMTRVNVPDEFRGLGVGSALLREVTREADACHVALWAEAQPYTDCPMTQPQLMAFYERHGFTRVGHRAPSLMLRRAR